MWDTTGFQSHWKKLRYLKITDCPLSVLQLLNCPALEEFSIQGYNYEFISHFRNFLSQCPPLHTLHVNMVQNMFDATMEEFLVESSPRHLSFQLALRCRLPRIFCTPQPHSSRRSWRSIPMHLTKGAFRILPELEGLELIGFGLALASFIEFVATRWNAPKRRLKSMKLTRCSFQLSLETESDYSVTLDPAISSSVRSAVESFTDEGLLLEIS